jgi:hypothetical protein
MRVGLNALSATAVAAVLSASAPAAGQARYTIVSVAGTTADIQVAHVGPGEDGEGAATVRLTSLSRPGITLAATSKRTTVLVRVTATGDAHARFVLAERAGLSARTVECSSPLHLAPRGVPAVFDVVRTAGRPHSVRVRLTLPYVRAPYVEATDLFPSSGPCDAATGAVERTLRLARTVPFRSLEQPRLVLAFAGKVKATAGDVVYTTTWKVVLTLVRVR